MESFLFAPAAHQGNDVSARQVNAAAASDEFNSIFTNIQNPASNGDSMELTDANLVQSQNNPSNMADIFNVPYLGKLPMDRNLMHACENGESFVDTYPHSVAAKPFLSIVNKITSLVKLNLK